MSAPTEVTVTGPSADHPEVGWLWQIVGKTPKLTRPMTWARAGEEWTLATTGQIIAARKGGYGFPPAHESLYVGLERVLFAPRDVTAVPVSLDALRRFSGALTPDEIAALPPCGSCSSTGRHTCPGCSGDGEVDCECKCGHEHERECEDCWGRGWYRCDCHREPPSRADGVRRIQILGVQFNANLLGLLLARLPASNGTWQQSGEEGGAKIVAGDWIASVMPMRIVDKVARVPRFTLPDNGATP